MQCSEVSFDVSLDAQTDHLDLLYELLPPLHLVLDLLLLVEQVSPHYLVHRGNALSECFADIDSPMGILLAVFTAEFITSLAESVELFVVELAEVEREVLLLHLRIV